MRVAFVSTTVTLAAVVFTGCGSASDSRGADSAKVAASGDALPKVRLALAEHLSLAPIMIASAEGFFREEGVDVEFVPAMRPQESLVALVTGDLDVRPGPMSAGFLSAIAQKAPIRAVADQGYLPKGGCMYHGIVLRNGLDSAGSPPIKRMRTGSDSPGRFITERLLAMRGIPLKGIETVSVPDVAMAGALESGALDAIASTEPTLSRLAKVGRRWMSGQQATPDQQWGVIAFSKRLLTTDHAVGVRFIRAYRRGIAQFGEGKTARNVSIIAKGTGDSEEVIREACWPSFRTDSRINWATVNDFQVWARANNLMDSSVTQAQAWDSSFLVGSDSASRK